MKLPEGYQALMPYLILKDGRTFLDFAKKVFNAREKMYHEHEDGGLMHAELWIHESVLMIGGSNAEYPPCPAGMMIYVENADECYQRALQNGCTSLLEPQDQDYGRSCGVRDPWGNTWWITSVID
ncbi:MAG TPA: VOC family protein [Cryomorphaceae bacterium]|nr:glyoxalase [Owenweeksia sp.]HAD97275.1 VOC family protein [Cryomorphaceae bacterium]HBF20351.1 VOC family protein [Cryomorphaceae bacterium]HCQ14839.1 VOC family protein [Cryomorphaceae bacterium]|tara:strand:- start:41 stop:415 length:375 start_codon:yes stop_codon:yes gene_type:complete